MMTGRKALIGPSLPRPSSLRAPAPLEDRDQYAEGGRGRDQVHQGGRQRHDQRAERDQQQQEAQRDDRRRRSSGSRSPVTVAKSLKTAVTPPTCDLLARLRDHLVAQPVDQLVRLLGLR